MKGDTERMSDNSESGSEDAKYDRANGRTDDICRDFLRNVCKRGKRCKYRHPNSDESNDVTKRQDYTFCHDYQNTGCRRNNCKFLHCTREEEEYYRQNGQLPVRLQQAAALGIGVVPNDLPLLKGEIPVCKDYLKGECRRGTKCKFRHICSGELEYEMRKQEQRNNNMYDPYEDDFDRFERFDYGPSALKRRRVERDFESFDSFPSSYEGRFSVLRPLRYQLLEEENTMLRRKVEELKKQVADLTATNEVLLEQNARYRVNKSNTVQAVNSLSQQLTSAVNSAPAVAAALAPQPLNHLATSLAQQIALNSDLATQHALQQRLARELAPAQGSLAAQQLNSSVTLNPNMVPVSLPQTNMSAISRTPVSIQQSLAPVVTMTQSSCLPQNLAVPSNPLVSYPIVSQSMRSAGVPSSMGH